VTIRQLKPVKLTPAQKRTLAAFSVAQKKAGVPPELAEVAAEMGATKQNAYRLLEQLVALGRLKKVGRFRGYRLLRKAAA
jgi:DNA-binding IclR family transcriptional regulator